MTLLFVDGIAVNVVRKDIDNMHLYVKQDCSVVLNAPLDLPMSEIEEFLKSKSKWMKKNISQYSEIPLAPAHRYETGEVFRIFGSNCYLKVTEGTRYSARMENDEIFFTVREGSSPEQRKKHFDEFLISVLTDKISVLMPIWQEKTGLRCSSWEVKQLRGKWGCCNVSTRHITFNLSLVEKAEICVEYIILHELAHTVTRYHDKTFHSVVSEHMPDWKRVNKLLNYS